MGLESVQKKIPRSRWLRIIPAVILIYMVAAMDRSNISFAIAGGMEKALGLTATFSGIASGIFFIGYLVLQVPGGIYAERKSATKYIGWTVAVFGLVAALTGLAQNSWELLVGRFFLGVAEGGLFPAILVIITRWFPNEERGRANSLFLLNSIISGVVGGPIAGWILSISNWHILFVAEGLLSFVLLAIFMPFISNSPAVDRRLSKAEKDYILSKLAQGEKELPTHDKKKESIGTVLSRVTTWKMIIIYFCMQVGIYGYSLWLPSEIKALTNVGIGIIGVLSIFPYIASAVGQYVIAHFSDRSNNRRLHTAWPLLGLAICLVLSILTRGEVWISFTFLMACGVFLHAPSGVFWTIPPLLSNPDAAASERGIINALGNLGGFLGPFMVGWVTSLSNYYIGFSVLVVFLLIGFIVTLMLPRKAAGKSERVIEDSHVVVK